MGVASKEYISSIASNAESRVLRVHVHIIFKVKSHCSIILHQFPMRKEGVALALTAVKWFFHVQQLRSEMLVRWMSAGVYCTLDF